MKNMLKVLIFIAIVLGSLFSIKLMSELWATKMKKYFVVD